MEQAGALWKVFGTEEPVATVRHLSTGPLSFLYSTDGLRRISWHGTELVRALAWPMRDRNWGTYPAEILDETVEHEGNIDARLTFAVGDGRLVCELRIRALPAGEVLADLTMTPKGGPFSTNRAGFTVLHPIRHLAGAPLLVTHPDGSTESTRFPEPIQPDQPVKDISGLQYGIGAQSVDIVFDGETFEMEDQRNWSDASYKTYCVPLVHPFTYDIAEPTRQSVRMSFSGAARSGAAEDRGDVLRTYPTGRTAPEVGLALEPDWLPGSSRTALHASHILIRATPETQRIAELAAFAGDFRAVDLEIVLPDAAPVGESLRDMAAAFAAHGIVPRHVIALREAYLGSHQPVGPWPEGPAPNDMLDSVREAFPHALVGGGMLTNFTELNRCRPDTSRCDYVTHGLTPLVHAGDDMSVLETLEALPQIFSSTEALCNGLPYRLGLASIGMRSNPYGAAVAENPDQVRRTMARIEPRHRGLFGAAYAVGVLAATEASTVEALCLGAPVGPFGLLYEPMAYPQAGYDGTKRRVYPLYHVVREASAMAGQPRLAFEGLPDGVAAYGVGVDGARRIVLGNISDAPRDVSLGFSATMALLDTETFDPATLSADWLDETPREHGSALVLPPFSLAFVASDMSQH